MDLRLAACAARGLVALDRTAEGWPVVAAVERADPTLIADLAARADYRAWTARTALQCHWEATEEGPAPRMPPGPGAPVHRHTIEGFLEVELPSRTLRSIRVAGGRDLKVSRRDATALARRLGCTPDTLGGATSAAHVPIPPRPCRGCCSRGGWSSSRRRHRR